jgi:mRNA (guanine-N7-)-methyltransferase
MISINKFIDCIIKYGKIQNFIISNKVTNIENLRKFHNYIKLQLILQASDETNAKNLLDIACGRGGDLQKWLRTNIKYIFAFDSHKESIFSSIKKGNNFDGAIARFQNIKQSYKNKMPFINFKALDILDSNILNKINSFDSNKTYDIVSCQFALHYFAKDDNTLDCVLKVISSKLRKDGLFIGTATDGDLINNILKYGNVNIPLLTLVKREKNNYLFYIHTENKKDLTRLNYFELQGVSSEFYIFKEKLKNIASKNNLELIEYKSFYDWYKSFLNFSFVFKKI